MSKKTYRKFNFWEVPTANNLVEKVDPSFFKEVEKELEDNLQSSKSANSSLIKHETLSSVIQSKIENLDISSEKQNVNLETQANHKIKSTLDIAFSEGDVDYKDLIQDIHDSNGGQWKVLLFCAERCLETGTLSTGYIRLPNMAKKLNLNQKTIYTTLYRLEKHKKLIIRQKGKEGSGGKSRFMLISDKIRNYILSYRDNRVINESHQTASERDLNDLADMDEWKKIDTTPLKDIGLTEKHILQLKRCNTPKVVQESINHFSFGLKNNEQIKKYLNPLLVFIGVLRKGEAWIEQNYMSANEIALNQLIEHRKNKITKLSQIEDEYFFAEYNLWEKSLSTETKDQLLPEDIKKVNLSPAKNAFLRTYFKENIWPSRIPIELNNLKEELNLY